MKGLTLPHARVKPKRGDKDVLADLGLLALLPDVGPEVDRPRPKPAPVKRPRASAAWVEAIKRGSARRLERIRAAPHLRPRAHILRVMEPGAAYVVNDIIRALDGIYRADAIKAQMRFRMLRDGMLERLPAPRGMTVRAPLMHGAPHKDPLTWLYRLTPAGIDERQAVIEHDTAT